ncbi:hypothetical protein QPM17_14375 [Marinobacter sp. TBZ242]|uniref:Tyr recombinase domain-containing protein n=1 Tax=Marinobacter azerbaijanicus TaxID=3050455 RepID=A0ABT7IF06_9GAMM|nr:hypothetical protein [Marinobacter sp. TBZ242]MDL0432327.1 hypothetical protein [Marinobacter sp. TBZ242]
MLLNELTIATENPEQLLNELVQPREDWFDMEVIAGLLPGLLRALESLSVTVTGAEKLLEWLSSGEIEVRVREKKQPGRGVSGLKTGHPQHAGLRELAQKETGEVRLQMAALVIVLAYQWRHDVPDDEQNRFSSRLYEAWRALWLMGDTAVNCIPRISEHLERFAATFARRNEMLDRRRLSGNDIRYLVELQRFFKHFLGDGQIVRRHRRTSADRQVWSLTSDWEPLDKDSDTEVDQSKTVRIHTTRPSEVKTTKHFLAGNAPDELDDATLLLETGEQAKPELGERSDALLRKLQPQRAACRRVNSVLPGRWESLSEYELNLILESLVFRRSGLPTVRLFILLLLLTGRAPEVVLRARVVKSRDQLPQDFKNSEDIYLVADERTWVCGTLKPKDRRELKSGWHKYFEESRQELTFRIPDQFWQVMALTVKSAGGRATSKSAALFSRRVKLDGIINRVNSRLKDLKRSTGSRLTVKRIQNLLFDSLMNVSTDLIDVCLITGKHPPFGPSAAIYYHTRAAEQLAEYYDRVVVSWARAMGGATRPDQPELSGASVSRVGSPLSIRSDVMRAVVVSLQEQLQEYRKVIDQPSYLWRFHNLYTAYVNLMLLWATGYRAVRDPIADPSELNRKRGFVVISDKEGDDMGHSRVVYLPERMIRQLDCYEAHRLALSRRLQMAGCKVTLSTFLWFLTSKYETVPATPKELAAEIVWVFPWPLNTSRHTLRGYLRDRDVPGDLVDTFMGHWGIGTEPWARHSALDPYAFKEAVGPVIDELLESLGFDVLEGIDG